MEFVEKAQEAAAKFLDLHKDVVFLNKHLEQFPPDTPRMRFPSNPRDTPRAASPPSPTPKRRQYPRYMEQEIARGSVALNKNAAIHERIRNEYEDVLDKSTALEREKAKLLKQAGVKNTADIPGLIPKKGYNPRVNFNESREE